MIMLYICSVQENSIHIMFMARMGDVYLYILLHINDDNDNDDNDDGESNDENYCPFAVHNKTPCTASLWHKMGDIKNILLSKDPFTSTFKLSRFLIIMIMVISTAHNLQLKARALCTYRKIQSYNLSRDKYTIVQ